MVLAEQKVLVINTTPTSKNGITNVIFNYLTAMNGTGWLTDYLSINQPERMYVEAVESRGGRCYVLARSPKRIISYWWKLRHLVKEKGYDIVHIHGNSHTTVLELSAARSGGCKVRIVHGHSSYCRHPMAHWMLSFWFHRLCTDGLACSDEAGKYMFGERRFVILHNGINTQRFAFNEERRKAVRRQLGWEMCRIVGNVGYLYAVKNHSFVLDVFEALYRKNDRYRLLLVGEGDLRKDIEKKIRQKGLKDAVLLTGNIDEVEDYLNAMDVVLMPSRYEGLPLTLIEEQANGLRCVVADTITRAADITGNLTFLSLREDKEKWAQFIETAIGGEDREERSVKAIDDIKKSGYDISHEARKLRDFYLHTIRG